MQIKQVTSSYSPEGVLVILGLGDDNRVYLWNTQVGGWQPGWQVQQAPMAQAPSTAPEPARKARRAAAAKATKTKGRR